MLIERHASWIALNSVVGCPNNCIYCFLNDRKACKPHEECSPEEAVKQLLSSNIYNNDDAICIMPNTDIFATPTNKKHFFLVCSELKKKNVKNLIAIITKREITEYDAKIIAYFRKYLNLVVYVSYSGLGDTFEKGIRKNGEIESVLSMKNLKKYDIPCFHYWRPLILQNTNDSTIKTVLDNVKKYCLASCMTGLKLYGFMNCSSYWPEAQKAFDKGINPECFVPKGSFDKIMQLAKEVHYKVYVDNVCLMAEFMKKPCEYGSYLSERCLKYNICSEEQRKICGKFYDFKKPMTVVVDKNTSFNDIIEYVKKEKVHVQGDNKNSTYWQNSFNNTKWYEL